MTQQELMQSLAHMRGLLYRCSFSGDQMMVAAECVRVINTTMNKLNQENLHEHADNTTPNQE